MQSHEEFMADLAVWLSSMQFSAPDTFCDQCMASTSPAGAPVSPVNSTLQLCNTISSDLQAYASECNIPHLKALLQAQDKRVRLAAWRDAANSPDPAPTLLQQAKQQLVQAVASLSLIRPCPICDQVYYTRLRTHLRSIQGYLNLVSGLTLLCAHFTGIEQWSICSCAWWLLHLMAGLRFVFAQQVNRSRWLCWLPSGEALQGGTWVAHVCLELSSTLGWAEYQGRMPSIGPLLAVHTAFSVVTEQVSSEMQQTTNIMYVIVLAQVGSGNQNNSKKHSLRTHGRFKTGHGTVSTSGLCNVCVEQVMAVTCCVYVCRWLSGVVYPHGCLGWLYCWKQACMDILFSDAQMYHAGLRVVFSPWARYWFHT